MSLTMTADNLRQRHQPASAKVLNLEHIPEKPISSAEHTEHPGGRIKHGTWKQALRMFLFAAYFNGSIIASVLPSDDTTQTLTVQLQYRHHPTYRLAALLLQQGPILRLDGYDQATLWHRLHNHDLLVGARQDADQWR